MVLTGLLYFLLFVFASCFVDTGLFNLSLSCLTSVDVVRLAISVPETGLSNEPVDRSVERSADTSPLADPLAFLLPIT